MSISRSPRLLPVKRETRILDHRVGLGLAGVDRGENGGECGFSLEIEVLDAGGIHEALLDELAGGCIAVEAGHQDVPFLADRLPHAAGFEHGSDRGKEEIRRGEHHVDLRVRGHGGLEVGKRRGRVPFRSDFDRRVEPVLVLLDCRVEAFLAADGIRIAKVSHDDQRREHGVGGRVCQRLLDDVVDGLFGDRLVVGDDDQARAEIGRRPVEHRDRRVVLLGLLDDGHGALAVLGDDDDAVDALRDAVADLFELAVGVFVGVAFDDGVTGILQGRGDRLVAGDPELGLEVLEGKADRGGGTGGAEAGAEAGDERAGGQGCQSLHGFTPGGSGSQDWRSAPVFPARGSDGRAIGHAVASGWQMSLTDFSTASGAKTRSSQSSRRICGLALAMACRAPSENLPSGKAPKAMASSMLR